jgi:hypothetical protein
VVLANPSAASVSLFGSPLGIDRTILVVILDGRLPGFPPVIDKSEPQIWLMDFIDTGPFKTISDDVFTGTLPSLEM